MFISVPPCACIYAAEHDIWPISTGAPNNYSSSSHLNRGRIANMYVHYLPGGK